MLVNKKDFIEGQTKDIDDERKEFSRDIWIDDMIVAIDSIVKTVVEQYTRNDERNQINTLLVSKVLEIPAVYVASKFKLELVTSIFLPENEVFVTHNSKIESVINSRFNRKKEGLWLPN